MAREGRGRGREGREGAGKEGGRKRARMGEEGDLEHLGLKVVSEQLVRVT